MKKLISVLLAMLLIVVFALFAIGSGEEETVDQGNEAVDNSVNNNVGDTEKQDVADTTASDNSTLGKYSVVIDSCRMSTDYEGKPVVIVKYIYTNVSNDTATSFMIAFDDNAYQGGIGLNNTVFVDDSAGYSSDNQMKEIKAGATLDVEVAYTLNDATTPIDIEIKELISFNDKTITKTFTIA